MCIISFKTVVRAKRLFIKTKKTRIATFLAFWKLLNYFLKSGQSGQNLAGTGTGTGLENIGRNRNRNRISGRTLSVTVTSKS